MKSWWIRGLVRYIGMSNMTVPKLEAVLPLCRIKPAALEMELHPSFQQPKLFDYAVKHDILPIGYCPLGSPSRPERDRTAEDSGDSELPSVAQQRRPAFILQTSDLKWQPSGASDSSLLRQGASVPVKSHLRHRRSADSRRDGSHHQGRQKLPPHQRPGFPLGRRPWLGRSLGSGWQDYRKRIRLL